MKNERMKYMKKVIAISSLLLAISFTAVAQIAGATQQEEQNAFGASAPSAAFQSTSSMSGSGSTYSANPELNADGTAAYQGETYSPAKAIRRPGGVRKDENDIPNPDVEGQGNDPIGDAVLPLLLMSLAFGMFVYFRRKRSEA
jgi:hypothetical protein